MSEVNEYKPRNVRPFQDPNRKEVLIISAMQVSQRKKQMEIFETLRDDKAQVIGFEEFLPDKAKTGDSVDISRLEAFMQGFQSAFRTKFN
jgi:hypothetical protein